MPGSAAGKFPLRQMRIRGGELDVWGAVMHARRKVRLPPTFPPLRVPSLPPFEARILFWVGGARARRLDMNAEMRKATTLKHDQADCLPLLLSANSFALE